MTSAAFAASLPFVLRWEGGFVNHPSDPGGATNKGVTQRVYDDWRQRQGLPTQDVRHIADTEVNAIYEGNYWKPPRCDVLRRQLDLVQFDTAVNMGVNRAVRMLQESVRCAIDGAFGDGTKKAADECDLGNTLVAYCDAREKFYRTLVERKPGLAVFLKGWLNRLNALRTEVGLPGFEAAVELDFGETGYIKRVPDLGDPTPDLEDLRKKLEETLGNLRGAPTADDLVAAKKLVGCLRDVRDWQGMRRLAESISRLDIADAKNRKLYAQSLIETGDATAAADMLRALVQRLSPGDRERAEAQGLIGRVYKQIFFDASDKTSAVARDALSQSIAHYREPFEQTGSPWHGVNLVAVLNRARKLDPTIAPEFDPMRIARDVVTTLATTPAEKRDEWYFATLAEANLGLSDYDAVEEAIRNYAARPDANAFAVAGTLRQFTEVWGLEEEGDRGRGIVALLRARLLSLPGGSLAVNSNAVGRLRAQTVVKGQPEAILGNHGAETYRWWRTGLDRALGVASIRKRLGTRIGTGFAVRAGEIGLEPQDELLVLTNFHVVNPEGVAPGIAPSLAEITFEALDSSRPYQVENIVWCSPTHEHDATVLRLRKVPERLEPMPIASQLPDIMPEACVYIIGHPGGRDLAFSFQDNELLDHEGPPKGRPQTQHVRRVHYGAPTESGSSGSPVFNNQWDVIALHHFGGRTGVSKLNGATGTYSANEGISIESIREAISAR